MSVDMIGVWGEFSTQSDGRSRTVGRLYFDKERGFYAFDGMNYYDDGRVHCSFKTVTGHVDEVQRRFYYVFNGVPVAAPNEPYYGFGVVNLTLNDDGVLVPRDGHFMAVDGGEPVRHTMQKLQGEYVEGAAAAGLLAQIEAR